MVLTETYNMLLVVISILAAIGSSFVALSTVPRIYSATSSQRSLVWVGAFGLSLGTGIWTMHFIGILALTLPIPVQFDLGLTVFSLVLAIAVSAIAITPLRRGGSLRLFQAKTLLIGSMMGLGIAGMHYSGMAAIRMDATMHHHTPILILAVVIAIVASTSALLIANQLRGTHIFNQLATKSMAAIVMGLAVSAMHYTAMYGMDFMASGTHQNFESAVNPLILAVFLITIAFLIQGSIIISALFDEAYAISKAATDTMRRRADINKGVSDILSVAMEKQSLEEMMDKVLHIILSIEWLSFEKKGSIFIADSKSQTLNMIAQHNLQPELIKQCGKLPFGRCLCGTAAVTGKLIYKNCIDHEHVIHINDMNPHGHYCVPVISQGETIAVINLYLSHDHKQSDDELQFLSTVADAIAPMIQNYSLEAQALKIYAAIDQAGEAVLISDNNGRIEYVNKAFSENTGYTSEESIGQKPSILKSGNQDQAFYQKLWKTIRGGESWQGEVIERRKDGSLYPAMLTISPIRNDHGEITHFVGIHEDLSEHKNLEAQFRQAQKMDALGTLVGGIAHDFNNMLAGMIGNLFIIKRKVKDRPEVLERVERVEAVGFQAAEMIKQMLVFARSNDVEMHNLSLSSFIKEAFNLHQVTVPENIRMNKKICGENLPIMGNPSMLQQVMLNLTNNAIDAVEDIEQPVINFSLSKFKADSEFSQSHSKAQTGSDYAYICISDNGYGIKPEYMEQIFDPFFTSKEAGKGTGLGLSMTSTIIESHEGFITVESKEGQGSAFHIYLPLNDAEIPEHVTANNSDIVGGKGDTVLIADDNEMLRQTTAETLQSLGYHTLLASNGLEAVDIFRTTSVDVVILDVVMPVAGGVVAARAILKIDPQAKIIFATGYDRERALNDAGELDQIPVLCKPFGITELHCSIRMLLD